MLRGNNILDKLPDYLPVGLFIFDHKHTVIVWNNLLETVTGIKKDQVNGKPLHLFIENWKEAGLESSIGKLLAEGGAFRKNLSFRNGQRTTAAFPFEFAGMRNEDGVITGVAAILSAQPDTGAPSPVREIQDDLLQGYEKLAITLNSIGDGVITTDNMGFIVNLNPVAEQLTGWSREEAQGKYLEEVLNIFDAQTGIRCDDPFKKTIAANQTVKLSHNTELRQRTGAYLYIAGAASPVIRTNGELTGCVLVFRNATQEYETASKAKAVEEMFKVAFHASPDAISITRLRDGVYVEVNNGFKNLSGYLPEELIGKSSIGLNIWKNKEDRERLIRMLRNDGYVENFEAKYLMKDKTLKTGLMSACIFVMDSQPYIFSVTRDITTRKKIEEDLKTSESRIRQILKHDPNSIAVFDMEMRYIMVSDRFLKDYKLKERDIIGKSHYDVFPEIPDRWKAIHRRCLEGAVEKNDLDFLVRPDGKTDYIRWELRPWRTFSNEIGGMIMFTEVITERVTAELKLKERNQYIESILSALPVGILAFDPSTLEVEYYNEKFTEIFDFQGKTIRNVRDVLKMTGTKKVERENLAKMLENNVGHYWPANHWADVQIVTRSKKRKAISIFNIPLTDQNIVISAIQDITDRKTAEEERDRLFNLSIDMLFVAGFDGYFKQLNPAWERTLGWNSDELQSKPWLDFVMHEDQVASRIAHAKLREGKSMLLFENRYLCKNGSYKWLSWNAFPLIDQNLIFGVVRDMTEAKTIEEELKLRNAELNTFVYKVSHDLRAPLSSIRGLVSLIKLDMPYLTGNEYLRMVENRIVKLDNFIRDILSHSKNLNTEVRSERINFREVIDNCLNELAYLDNFHRIEKKVIVSGEDFFSDPVRIYEIFRNMISNSIKYINPYIEPNIIRVEVNIFPEQAQIMIIDNGLGIPIEHRVRIFEMFFKGSDKSDSSGIGLYIVQQAVKKLGGTIEVESETNKGTKFTIILPNKKNFLAVL